MPEIILKNVTKTFDHTNAVDHLNLVIKDRDFITLLGPSGCGKTTTLRMIAGLETPTSGEIIIDGQTVFSSEKGIDVPPQKRNVGFLFQNYALWPHMTVLQNITFGLENLKWEKEKIRERSSKLMKMLQIEEYKDRYPAELSGGQQQRVAIARTLATGPRILLMDEPLSNLDAKLRMEMRSELKRLHMETDSTFVYVTHDQLEAMTLATRISLMKKGKLQQFDAPLTVYNCPSNAFTADFIGNPSINLIPVKVESRQEQEVLLHMGSASIHFHALDSMEAEKGESLLLGIRPENIEISDEGTIEAKVYSALPSGMETVVKLDVLGLILTAVVFGDREFHINDKVKIRFRSRKNHLFRHVTRKAGVSPAANWINVTLALFGLHKNKKQVILSPPRAVLQRMACFFVRGGPTFPSGRNHEQFFNRNISNGNILISEVCNQ